MRARVVVAIGIALGTLGLAAAVGALATREDEPAQQCRNTLVPAYVTPDELETLAEAPRRPRVVVVNPASGPGHERRADYAKAIERARESGMPVLGYVATAYGARDASAVVADIDAYHRWYGVDGIFVDEAAREAQLVAHYRAIVSHARLNGDGLVVLNPGVVPARGYFDLADVVVTFEGPVEAYAAAVARMPAWLDRLSPNRVAHLLHGASREEAIAAVDSGARAGYVYVTSGAMPNPWRTIPTYLDALERLLVGCAR